jgi:hypothetical protein
MQALLIQVVVKAILVLIGNPQFNDWLERQKQDFMLRVKQEIVGDAEATVKGLVGAVPKDVQNLVQPLFGNIKVPGIDIQGLANAIAQELNPLHWGQGQQ